MSLYSRVFAWLFTFGILGSLAWVFRAKGLRGIILIFSFQASLVLTQLSVHWVAKDAGFPYTSFLSLLQFVVLCIVVACTFLKNPFRLLENDGLTELHLCSHRFFFFYVYRVLPLAAVMGLGVAMNNASLALIDPGLNAVLGSLTPACTGLLSALLGTQLPRKAWLSLMLASCGGVFTINGGLSKAHGAGYSGTVVLGMSLSFAAVFMRSSKSVLIQRAVCPAAKDCETGDGKGAVRSWPVLQPFQLLVLQTPTITLVLLVLALLDARGISAPLSALLHGGDGPRFYVLACFLTINVACAAALNFIGLSMVQMLGATAMQICGKCNIFITMAFSAAYAGETIDAEVLLGSAIILTSAWMFTSATTKSTTNYKSIR